MTLEQLRELFIQFPFLLSSKFSRFAGVPHASLYKWVHGTRSLNDKNAAKLIAALEKLRTGL